MHSILSISRFSGMAATADGSHQAKGYRSCLLIQVRINRQHLWVQLSLPDLTCTDKCEAWIFSTSEAWQELSKIRTRAKSTADQTGQRFSWEVVSWRIICSWESGTVSERFLMWFRADPMILEYCILQLLWLHEKLDAHILLRQARSQRCIFTKPRLSLSATDASDGGTLAQSWRKVA